MRISPLLIAAALALSLTGCPPKPAPVVVEPTVTLENFADPDYARLIERFRANPHVSVKQKLDKTVWIIVRSGVSFTRNGTTPSPTLNGILDDIAAVVLESQVQFNMNIVGHTDDTAPKSARQARSEAYANSARDYLIAKGLDGNLIVATGKGSTDPIVNNDSQEARDVNRRVEFLLKAIPPKNLACPPGAQACTAS